MTMTKKLDFNVKQSAEIDKMFNSLVPELNSFKDLRSLVIILHTRIEFYLERILYSYFFIEDDTKRELLSTTIQGWSFKDKFKLINKIRVLPDSLIQKISNVNQVRNICAHKINYLERIKSEKGLSIDFFDLNAVKIQCADILVNLNECLAKT